MDNLLLESLTRYFKHITNTGYMNYKEVRKLLVFILIQEMLSGYFGCIVTASDYKILSKALDCLYGSNCLIPYPDYYSLAKTDDSVFVAQQCNNN